MVELNLLYLCKNIKLAFRAWLFLLCLFFTCLFYSNAHAYSSLSNPAYALEEAQSGINYVDTFTVYTVDLLGNRTSTTYGIKLITASGSKTNSLSDVITSYTSDNFKISTKSVSGAQSFTTNGVTYYVTNTNGGAISSTNNLNAYTDSLFAGNKNTNTSTVAGPWGSLYSTSGTRTIVADFIGNTSSSYAGAIYSQSSSLNITGNFIGNTASRQGGAIYNNTYSTITNLNANFIGNKGTIGGAIYNHYRITNIIGNFIGNIATSTGGAINLTNSGSITTANANFIGNTAASQGGAIYNGGTITTLNGDFIFNTSTASNGGAILNSNTITNLTGDFLSNKGVNGGGIFNSGTIDNLNSNFSDNTSTITGAGLVNSGTITNGIIGGFYANKAGGNGGAIWNSGTIGSITGDFMSNTSGGYGGAIWNHNGGTIGTISGSFMGNSAVNTGGAIYTSTDLTFKADGKTNTFSDNTDSSGYNAIYIANTGNTNLNFNMNNKGEFIINDSIVATGNLTVDIKGDSIGFGASTFYLNDKITANGTLNINVDNANLYIGSYKHFDGTTTSGLDMTKGTITLGNSDLVINLKGYSNGDSILDGVSIVNTGSTSDLWVYNVANGTYEFGNNNLVNGWNNDLVFTANSLQKVEIEADKLIVGRVDSSGHFTGPLKDIILEALDDKDFCSSSASAGMDFLCGATNVFVGDVAQQQAVIESAAQMASIPGVNANTILANRATRNAIKLRQIENIEEAKPEVVVYDANGRVVFEEGQKAEITDNKGILKWLMPENSYTSAWLAPMMNNESVKNMQAGIFDASYNSNFYGINFGVDKTFADSFRLGLTFGTGGGLTTAEGDFEGIKNRFSFVTLNFYESLNVSNFTLNANVSYTRKFNNLTQDLSKYLMDSLYTSVDSYVWLLDLYAEYDFNINSKKKIINNISFVPYVGLELMQVKTKDYNVYVDKTETNTSVGNVVFNVTPEEQELIMIPIVLKITKKIEKEFGEKNNVWSFTPKIEAGALFTFGDLYDKTVTKLPDLNSTATFNLEIFDNITYNTSFGLDIVSSKCEFALDYIMQYSPNRKGHGLAIKTAYNF